MAKAIQVYIVEDNAISRISIETMLLENEYEVSGSAAEAEIAWKEIQKTPIDLILLDINLLGEKNGIWLAQQIRKNLNIPFVYLTAFGDQQTLKEVLETNPNGYLMKPYQEPVLITTISIAIKNFLNSQKETVISDSGTVLKNVIYVKEKYIRVKLHIEDICFIKSDGNYLEIKLHKKTQVVRSKLSEFQKLLPAKTFCQTHQRYLINIKKIDVFGKDYVTINSIDIPISQKYKKEMEELFPII